MIEGYFRKQTRQIADDCLKEYKTKEQWEKARPELRRQFLEMVGLWPLPAKTDLKAQITGIVDMPKYTIEKVYFQSWPNLYVTAHVYVPRPAPKKAPAILYLCGHGNVVKKIDGTDACILRQQDILSKAPGLVCVQRLRGNGSGHAAARRKSPGFIMAHRPWACGGGRRSATRRRESNAGTPFERSITSKLALK